MNILCTIAKITIGILFGIAVLIVYALAMAASMADSKMGYDDRESEPINPDADRVIVDDDPEID